MLKIRSIEKIAFNLFILLAFFYLASIPKLAALPFSPKYFLFIIICALFIIGKKRLKLRFVYDSFKTMWFYLIYMVLFNSLMLNIDKIVSACEMILFLMFTIIFVKNRDDRIVLLLRCIAVFTLLSAIWFLCNIYFYDTFISLRSALYGSFVDYNRPHTIIALRRPTGLTFDHHIMGYQMTAGTVVFGLLYFVEKNILLKIFLAIGLFFICFATYFTAERSVIPAIGITLILYLVLIDKRIIYLILVSFIFIFFVININQNYIRYSKFETLNTRIRATNDIRKRIGWQIAAFKFIIDTPLGSAIANRAWDREAESYGADFSDFGYDIKAVHNCYLSIVIVYGWIIGFVVFLVLIQIVRNLIAAVRCLRFFNSDKYAIVIGFTLIALLIQAMFHSAGIFTNEPISFFVLSLFIACNNISNSRLPRDTHFDGILNAKRYRF